MNNFSAPQINDMRDWLLECDMDEDYLDELSDAQVIGYVRRNFDGGLSEFINVTTVA